MSADPFLQNHAPKNTILTPQCPSCKAGGPLVLVISTVTHWRTIGSPVIECLKCHAYFTLGQMCQSPMDFFTYVPLIERQQ